MKRKSESRCTGGRMCRSGGGGSAAGQATRMAGRAVQQPPWRQPWVTGGTCRQGARKRRQWQLRAVQIAEAHAARGPGRTPALHLWPPSSHGRRCWLGPARLAPAVIAVIWGQGEQVGQAPHVQGALHPGPPATAMVSVPAVPPAACTIALQHPLTMRTKSASSLAPSGAMSMYFGCCFLACAAGFAGRGGVGGGGRRQRQRGRERPAALAALLHVGPCVYCAAMREAGAKDEQAGGAPSCLAAASKREMFSTECVKRRGERSRQAGCRMRPSARSRREAPRPRGLHARSRSSALRCPTGRA